MKNFLILILVTSCLFSCSEKQKDPPKNKPKNNDWSKVHSISFNQEINEREAIQIALFLDHHKDYEMTETETGLRYMIYKDSIGDTKPKNGQQVSISLKINLLDGTDCYSTIDKSDEESGINEAVKLMSIGDQAKLILPSHLAHGLLGDLDKIPPQSILLIDIQLNTIK